MDHEQAIRTLAAERYCLNEMQADERDAFEEHYFECNDCWTELRRAEIFAQNARVAAKLIPPKAEPLQVVVEPRRKRRFIIREWSASIAATVAMAFLIPLAVRQPISTMTAQPITLVSQMRGVSDEKTLTAGRPGVITTVITNRVVDAQSFRAAVRVADGREKQHWDVPIAETMEPLKLSLSPLPPGDYVLVIESVDRGGKRSEITRYPFQVVSEGRPDKRNN